MTLRVRFPLRVQDHRMVIFFFSFPLIPYSDEALSRLEEIEVQFRKASYFLAGLLSAEDVPAAICSSTLLLTQ